MQLRELHREPGEVVAEAGPLLLRCIHGIESTHAAVDRVVTLVDAMVERWPLVGVIAIVEHGTPQPDPELRRRIDAEMRRYGDRIVVAYGFLGIGYWRADAHAFGTERAAALGVPVIVETELEALAERVANELIGVDPAWLVEIVERLRMP